LLGAQPADEEPIT
jgi:hypothetical protein